ncbi:MAG: DNA methyltransferase [Cyanobacteria bacterium P01_H01_bin.15]
MNKEQIEEFIAFTNALKGDEKGEAQIFCDRLFRAFGLGGIIEANGALEARIKFSSGTTKFADCLWSPPGRSGVLIEMKRREEKNLESHFPQARDYWIEMNPEVAIGPGCQKPTYIILCNFDRFLIYRHLNLVDDIPIADLEDRIGAFNFLLSTEREPLFQHNVLEISQDAARTIGEIFKYLVFEKNVDIDEAQKFLLQCVLSLFSEDFGLLPSGIFTETIRDCIEGASSYDLMGALFRQMASEKRAKAGRYKEVLYFNGGLFDSINPLELDQYCLERLATAADYNWKNVNPAIFGALFESTMNSSERHAYGAHFTSESDVQKIVNPTITKPWKERLENAKTLKSLVTLHDELAGFRVLDPACGCGNFLFVAFLAMKDIEMSIIEKMATSFSQSSLKSLNLGISRVSTEQFFGLDVLPVAVEVAKTTMMLAKEIASHSWNARIGTLMGTLGLSLDEGLPLDRLDDNIYISDALLDDWPEFDVVVGNPPFQSKNKMKQEMDSSYIDSIRQRFPDIPGRADYCVYWIYKAHSLLKEGQRAGLVGTNTIRQNYSREGGLDYVVNQGGVITNAVSSQVWSGDAVVHVSIVNWIKGTDKSNKILANQLGDSTESPFEYFELKGINAALSPDIDVTGAQSILANSSSQKCYQGQTHGHQGFLLAENAYQALTDKSNVYPYMIGDDLLTNGKPSRYVIDINFVEDSFQAQQYSEIYNILRANAYPDLKRKAEEEHMKTNKNSGPRQNHLKKWWRFWRPRDELMRKLSQLDRYIACSRVTKRPIFSFISSDIHPNDALQVFPLSDDYSFGILQSTLHWEWFKARCSTLKGDWRYTSNTVFDSFVWPQSATKNEIDKVSAKSIDLQKVRSEAMSKYSWGLRELYKKMEDSESNPVSIAQAELDEAVRNAYGFAESKSYLEALLKLNTKVAERESAGRAIVGPGCPEYAMPLAKMSKPNLASRK